LTVFVISETSHNIAQALTFGEIKVILPPNTQIAFSPAPTIRRISRALQDFKEDDYLLLIGDPTCIAIASIIAANKTKGCLKVLKWDRRERLYIPIQLNLKGESCGF
jgi:hypothetical protein